MSAEAKRRTITKTVCLWVGAIAVQHALADRNIRESSHRDTKKQ